MQPFGFRSLLLCMLIWPNYLLSTVVRSPDQSAKDCEQQNLAVCLLIRPSVSVCIGFSLFYLNAR